MSVQGCSESQMLYAGPAPGRIPSQLVGRQHGCLQRLELSPNEESEPELTQGEGR